MNNINGTFAPESQQVLLPWHRPEVQELDISDGTLSGTGVLADFVTDAASVASIAPRVMIGFVSPKCPVFGAFSFSDAGRAATNPDT